MGTETREEEKLDLEKRVTVSSVLKIVLFQSHVIKKPEINLSQLTFDLGFHCACVCACALV